MCSSAAPSKCMPRFAVRTAAFITATELEPRTYGKSVVIGGIMDHLCESAGRRSRARRARGSPRSRTTGGAVPAAPDPQAECVQAAASRGASRHLAAARPARRSIVTSRGGLALVRRCRGHSEFVGSARSGAGDLGHGARGPIRALCATAQRHRAHGARWLDGRAPDATVPALVVCRRSRFRSATARCCATAPRAS